MLRKNLKPRNKSEQMIFNNYVTIQKILNIKDQPIGLENLLDIHKTISNGTLNSRLEEGFLRTDNSVKVVDTTNGDTVHQPPDFNELHKLLSDLFRFFNDENETKAFIHPIIKASIIHFLVGFIHPFADGNGRTARALFYWYLLKKKYWLTEYLSISRLILNSKAQYARAFIYTEIDDNDLTYFISYQLKIMKQAYDELREYIQRKNEEKKRLSLFFGTEGVSHKQSVILEWFLNDQNLILTIKEAENRLGVSNPSARNYLSGLEQSGYLKMIKLNQVTKGYIKGEKFKAIGSEERRNPTGTQIPNQYPLFTINNEQDEDEA